jgi:putative ABC transport system substrate-binding protein
MKKGCALVAPLRVSRCILQVDQFAAKPTPLRHQHVMQTVARRVGIVSVGGPSADMAGPLPSNRTVRAFLRGMAELGYVFGRDFVTEPRGTDGIPSIGGLVDRQVDVIVATGGGTILSMLKQATNTIPIVMMAAPDPVQQGLVQRLARPGGNLTGMSLQTLEITGKRLQILKELVPEAQTTAVFWTRLIRNCGRQPKLSVRHLAGG